REGSMTFSRLFGTTVVVLVTVGAVAACNGASATSAKATGSAPAAAAASGSAASVPAASRSADEDTREVTLPAGTQLPIVLDTAVGSDTSRAEEPVHAHLAHAIEVQGVTLGEGS